ncbi:MAG: PEP-CTERM sorting domain-containing protein, partial [Pirellulaceae bacterium]|nr:PEP-CTERM sorting domain-containing protein [Pirellulaceae bacterium]
MRTGVSGTGVALFNQKGGTVNLDRVLWAGGNYSGTWGQVELSGTTTVTAVEYTSVGRHAGSFGYLNLNATGTLTTPNVRFHATEEGGGQGVFTFLGGTLKPNASTPDPADPATHFMRREGAATGDISIVIGTQGGTIDTDGYDIVISEPLQGMTDYGVSSISLMDGGSGYQGTPVVRITGGSGKGATALATVSGGVVTGITITNPGTGYAMADSLNVEILGGGGSPATVMDTSLALNAADGGLTKQGLGTLTLAGANTYTGLTSVQAGALNLTGSLLGDVDVETGAVLMGNGGTVGGDVDLDGTLGVAYNGDDDTINLLNIVGELDLTGATFSFSNLGAGALAEGEYVFATYGSLIGGPAVHVGLQSGWSVDYTYDGNSIALLVTGGDPIPGDANNSGTVDEADAKLMAANWGASGEGIGWAQGDFDGNGTVNAADAAILAAHWGMSSGSGAPETAGAPVPEPSVLIAILGGLLSLAWIRRKR